MKDYDLDQTGKAIKGLFTGIAFMCFLVSPSFPPNYITVQTTQTTRANRRTNDRSQIDSQHGYMKYTQPLFIQGLMTLKGVLESNEAKLHLFGKKADGELARPFKTAPGLMDQLTGKASGPQTDVASIKQAEKAGNKSE